ncbi:hypothetical protein L6452_32632 [Arctium lappa]|uniref:Uncharacterized protein n=1 Tax=Arctium lappa TaxID=4217 RepID=A0ACB8Z561_ARCLA|nr:hypothetical protein L6452_32632 [Arctium lappa]
MYKSKLNELCQKNRWGSPMYSFIKDGEEHSPLFRGSVVVNGFTFVSQSIFKSSKSAYNDAAQHALNHFTTFTRYLLDLEPFDDTITMIQSL